MAMSDNTSPVSYYIRRSGSHNPQPRARSIHRKPLPTEAVPPDPHSLLGIRDVHKRPHVETAPPGPPVPPKDTPPPLPPKSLKRLEPRCVLSDCIGVSTPESEGGIGLAYMPEDASEVDIWRTDIREQGALRTTEESTRSGNFTGLNNIQRGSYGHPFRVSQSANIRYRRSTPIILKPLPSNHPLHDSEIPASSFNTTTMRTRSSITHARRFSDPRAAPTPNIRRSNTHIGTRPRGSVPEYAMKELLIKQRTKTFPEDTRRDNVGNRGLSRRASSGCLNLTNLKSSIEDAFSAFKPKARVEHEQPKEIRKVERKHLDPTSQWISKFPKRMSSLPYYSSSSMTPNSSSYEAKNPRPLPSPAPPAPSTHPARVPVPAPLNVVHATTHRTIRPLDPEIAMQELRAKQLATTSPKAAAQPKPRDDGICGSIPLPASTALQHIKTLTLNLRPKAKARKEKREAQEEMERYTAESQEAWEARRRTRYLVAHYCPDNAVSWASRSSTPLRPSPVEIPHRA
jgi:hypothetical protein